MTEPTSNGADRHFGFGTRAIHAGAQPDPVTGARATPIHQTTSFVFDNAEHASSLFNLQTFGNVYSRISNPTVAVLEERVASLENGRAALACARGMAPPAPGQARGLPVNLVYFAQSWSSPSACAGSLEMQSTGQTSMHCGVS